MRTSQAPTSPSTSNRSTSTRIPHIEVRDDGSQWSVTEGNRPMMIKPADAVAGESDRRTASLGLAAWSPRTSCATPPAARSPSASPTRLPTASTSSSSSRTRACSAGRHPIPSSPTRCAAPGTGGPTTSTAAPGGWNDGRTRPLASIAAGDLDLCDGRGDVGRRARLRRAVPRQLPDLRAQGVGPRRVQRPDLRAALVAHRGDRAPAHVPRVDGPRPTRGRRQRRGDHQLRLPLDGDDDRAARAAHHVGRVRAPSRACRRGSSNPASASCRGCSRRWTTPTRRTTSGSAR